MAKAKAKPRGGDEVEVPAPPAQNPGVYWDGEKYASDSDDK